jgi:hypothetical protein
MSSHRPFALRARGHTRAWQSARPTCLRCALQLSSRTRVPNRSSPKLGIDLAAIKEKMTDVRNVLSGGEPR